MFLTVAPKFRIQKLSRNHRNLDLSLAISASCSSTEPFYRILPRDLQNFYCHRTESFMCAYCLSLRKGENKKGRWRERKASCSLRKALSQRRNLTNPMEPCRHLYQANKEHLCNHHCTGSRMQKTLSFNSCLSLKDELWLLEKEISLPEASILAKMLIKIKNNALIFTVLHSKETHLLQEPLPFFSYRVNEYISSFHLKDI